MSFVLHPYMHINSTHVYAHIVSTGDVGSTEGFLSGGTQLSLPEEPSCHAQEGRKQTANLVGAGPPGPMIFCSPLWVRASATQQQCQQKVSELGALSYAPQGEHKAASTFSLWLHNTMHTNSCKQPSGYT